MRHLKPFPKPSKERQNIFKKSSRDNNTEREDNENREIIKNLLEYNDHPNKFLKDKEKILDHA